MYTFIVLLCSTIHYNKERRIKLRNRRLKRKTRANSAEMKRRVATALLDPNILSINMVELMSKYKLNHKHINDIKQTVLERKINNGKAKELIEINKHKMLRRLRGKVFRAEIKHPLIHRCLISESNLSRLGKSYGITRERTRQLRNQFNDFCKELNLTVNKALDEIHNNCKERL